MAIVGRYSAQKQGEKSKVEMGKKFRRKPVRMDSAPKGRYHAKRVNETLRSPSFSLDPSRKINNRKKFGPAQVGRWKWNGVFPSPQSGAYNGLKTIGKISGSSRNLSNVSGIPVELFERWWYIDQGMIPPDEEKQYHVPTDDEMEDKAREETKIIEDNGRAKDEAATLDAKSQENYYRRVIAHKRKVASSLRRTGNRDAIQRAAVIENAEIPLQEKKIDQVFDELEIEKEKIADFVRDERQEKREELFKEQQMAQERADERVQELRKLIHTEIEDAVNNYYFEDDIYELGSYSLV